MIDKVIEYTKKNPLDVYVGFLLVWFVVWAIVITIVDCIRINKNKLSNDEYRAKLLSLGVSTSITHEEYKSKCDNPTNKDVEFCKAHEQYHTIDAYKKAIKKNFMIGAFPAVLTFIVMGAAATGPVIVI